VLALVPASKGLRELCLPKANLDASGASKLATTLGRLTGVTRLDLSDNQLTEAGIKSLVAAAASSGAWASLTSLNLSRTDMGDAGAAHLTGILASGQMQQLAELDVSNNGLQDALVTMATPLSRAPPLTTLNLSCNNWSPASLQGMRG
jgi:Leucine-rich repeat (LRR) protein